MNWKPKQRKCKVSTCRTPFMPQHPFQKWCGLDCAAVLGLAAVKKKKEREQSEQRKKEKAERAERKAKLEKHRPLSHFEKRAERACNDYCRTRDEDDPCISCGTYQSVAWQAGHYLSVGAHPTLRYNPDNIHKQCYECNVPKSGNQAAYRIGLVAKIGVSRVEALEAWHPPVKMTREACLQIEAEFRRLLKELPKAAQTALAA
jgi:hypothetical protein